MLSCESAEGEHNSAHPELRSRFALNRLNYHTTSSLCFFSQIVFRDGESASSTTVVSFNFRISF